MTKDKKISILSKRVSALEKENKNLKTENESLQKKLIENDETVAIMKKQHDDNEEMLSDLIAEYKKKNAELNIARLKYKEAMDAAYKIRKEYSQKAEKAIKKITKQKA